MSSVLDIRYPDDYLPVCHLPCESNTLQINAAQCLKEHFFV
jgi:hypothetical protein